MKFFTFIATLCSAFLISLFITPQIFAQTDYRLQEISIPSNAIHVYNTTEAQNAVNNASSGTVIVVHDGSYGMVKIENKNFGPNWLKIVGDPNVRRPRAPHFKIVNSTYVELRNMSIRGTGQVANKAVEVHGGHHIRIWDNEVTNGGEAGISIPGNQGVGGTDYIDIRFNDIHYNARWSNNGWWQGSGLSILWSQDRGSQADPDGYKIRIVGNLIWNNFVDPAAQDIHDTNWGITDGNCMILDINKQYNYQGRTLIKDNVCADNGGTAFALTKSHYADVINNTFYKNVKTPRQHVNPGNGVTITNSVANNGEVMCNPQNGSAGDMKVMNNIIVARDDNPNLLKLFPPCANVTSSNNVYVKTGYNAPGSGDIVLNNGASVLRNPQLDASKGDWTAINQAAGKGAQWPRQILANGTTPTPPPTVAPTNTPTPKPATSPSPLPSGDPGEVCTKADFNGDNVVDVSDHSPLFNAFLKSPVNPVLDLQPDGVIDLSDYSIFLYAYINCSLGGTPVVTPPPTQTGEYGPRPVQITYPAVDGNTVVRVTNSSELQQQLSSNKPGKTFIIEPGTYDLSSPISPMDNNKFLGKTGANGERAVFDGGWSDQYAICCTKSNNQGASGVHIKNLVFTRYNSPTDTTGSYTGGGGHASSAVHGDGDNWQIVGNRFIDNDGGLNLGDENVAYADGAYIADNEFIDNGHQSMYVNGSNLTIEHNRFYNNGHKATEGGANWWGIFKITDSANAIHMPERPRTTSDKILVRGNSMENNMAHALWLDVDNYYALIENNYIANNTGVGIYDELSVGSVIRNNHVKDNAQNSGDGWWFSGGQIQSVNSVSPRIEGNRVEATANGKAIVLIYETYRRHLMKDAMVTKNTVVLRNMKAGAGDKGTWNVKGGRSGMASQNNESYSTSKFDCNTYIVPDANGAWWAWQGSEKYTWSEFRSRGQEANGRMGTSESSLPALPSVCN